MHERQVIAELTRLYALEVEATQAYAAAVQIIASGELHDPLDRCWLEHQLHALQLQRALLERGHGVPETEPDVKGVVIGALTPPRRRLTLEDVLVGLRGNEQLTSRVCAKALSRALPAEVRALVERLADDERRHLEWLDRLVARRVWEAGAAARP